MLLSLASATLRKCRAREEPKALVAEMALIPAKACAVEGCGRAHIARGFCRLHYTRAFLGVSGEVGGPELLKSPAGRSGCLAEGCAQPRASREGYCRTHVARWRRAGSLEPPPVVPPRHGTNAMYALHGCRCDWCRAEHAARARRVRASLRARPEDAPHGTPSAYGNWGCRCDLCRNAWADAFRRRRREMAPAGSERV